MVRRFQGLIFSPLTVVVDDIRTSAIKCGIIGRAIAMIETNSVGVRKRAAKLLSEFAIGGEPSYTSV